MIVADSMALSQSINVPDFTPAVAPAIAPTVTPLLLLGLFTAVASRGRIRLTVFISDFQARVSSSLEGCSTLQKTVKVESY